MNKKVFLSESGNSIKNHKNVFYGIVGIICSSNSSSKGGGFFASLSDKRMAVAVADVVIVELVVVVVVVDVDADVWSG